MFSSIIRGMPSTGGHGIVLRFDVLSTEYYFGLNVLPRSLHARVRHLLMKTPQQGRGDIITSALQQNKTNL